MLKSLEIIVNGESFDLDLNEDYEEVTFDGLVYGFEVDITEDNFSKTQPYYWHVNTPNNTGRAAGYAYDLSDACDQVATLIENYKPIYDEMINYAEENGCEVTQKGRDVYRWTVMTLVKNGFCCDLYIHVNAEQEVDVNILVNGEKYIGDFINFTAAVNAAEQQLEYLSIIDDMEKDFKKLEDNPGVEIFHFNADDMVLPMVDFCIEDIRGSIQPVFIGDGFSFEVETNTGFFLNGIETPEEAYKVLISAPIPEYF